MKLPESIQRRISDCMASGTPFGFSKWADLEGSLWGVPLEVTENRIRVSLINPDGSFDEIRWFPISGLHCFDFDKSYARRLLMLGEEMFADTRYRFAKTPVDREAVLREAAASGQPIDIKPRDEPSYETVLVLAVAEGWVDIQELSEDNQEVGDFRSYRIEKLKVRCSPIEEWLWQRRKTEN